MKDSARYVKIVEWSDELQCYVGTAPGLACAECRGLDEQAVFAELCEAVDEAIAACRKNGSPLPPRTSGRVLAHALDSETDTREHPAS
jgi:hypothetical protein